MRAVDALPFYNDENFQPLWEPEKISHTVPEFSFTNQYGQTINREAFDSKITIVNFFFTRCPGICKRMTNQLIRVQAAFANDEDVKFLSHSVTPEADSIPVLLDYSKEHKAIAGQWHFLTGPQHQIYSISRKGYFADQDGDWKRDSTAFLHSENVLLVDGSHRIRGVYKGTIAADIDNLIADIRKLKEE